MKIDATRYHRPNTGPMLIGLALKLVGTKRELGSRLGCSRVLLWRLQNRPEEFPISYPMQVMIETLIREEKQELEDY